MKYNPPAGSQDPDAKYVTGQPGKVRGSAVPAEAVEHPQREIVEVIRQAGLEPSGDDLGQLWKALQQLFTEKVAVATKEKAGIVKPGSGLSVKEDGTLDVTVSAAIPGTIVAFAGTFGGEGNRHPIPLGGSEPDTGWVLCDGGSDGKGGTVPDLRGRMIMGVSDAYKAGSTGGSANHSHSLSGHCRGNDAHGSPNAEPYAYVWHRYIRIVGRGQRQHVQQAAHRCYRWQPSPYSHSR